MTIDGAEDGKSGTADAGPDEAVQQQPSGNKIQARGRRKSKRKRRRKTVAQSPTTDQTVDPSDSPTTSDDSNQPDSATKNEANPVSDDLSGDEVVKPNKPEESATAEGEERVDLPKPADGSADDTASTDDTTDVQLDSETSDNDETSDEPDHSETAGDEAEIDTADQADSEDQPTLDAKNDEATVDSLDGAYSTAKKTRSTKSGEAPTTDRSTSATKDGDTKSTVGEKDDTRVEESAAKTSPSADLDEEATEADNADEGNAKQLAQDDGESEPDTSQQVAGKPLTGERIDDLLSLVDAEPDEDDEPSSTNEAETASPPNIDDLFVGAIDKTESDPPSIDDLLPTESADKIETADSTETAGEIKTADTTGETDPSDSKETTGETDPSDSKETTGETDPSDSSTSEDVTIVQEIASTEELKIADKSSTADSDVDKATTQTPSDPANPIVVIPAQPESPTAEAKTSDTTTEAVADTVAPATAGSALPGSPVVTVPPKDASPTPPPSASPPLATPSDPAPTGELATAPQEKTPSTGLRLLKWAAVIAIVGYALLVAVWGIRVLGQQDKVASGVQIGETNIGGMTRADLDLEIDGLEDKLSTDGLEVIVNDEVIDTNPSAMGVEIDRSELTSSALEARRGGFVLFRPFTWLGQLGSTETIDIPYIYDSSKAASTTDLAIIPRLESPVEPAFKFVGTNLAATEGTSGITVDLDEIEDLLPTTIEAGTPYRMELNPTQADPTVETEVVDELASEINALTEDPIRIRILSDEIEVEPKTMREWAVLNLDGDDTSWAFDNDVMIADLKPRFPTLGTEDQQARIEVIDGAPTIINASETVICCEAGVDSLLLETLEADAPKAPEPDEDDPEAEPPEAPLRQAVFKPEIVGFDEGVAELESLGIIEEVSTFTTKHPCCANRVKNIQRFAELMQGSIVRPGESISLNDTVGRRTTAKGFFSDGAIVNGELKKSVGGGVSQYATTFLNAAFYSGVDITEYRSHSRYISRYPEGREATINFPSIDLEIYNDTDYGILIWNEWTDTSITVSFYSTKNAEVTDLPTRTTWNGQCRTVTTPRLVEYLDGKPDKEDEVFGYYFPGFNKRCDGSLINPPDEDDE